MKRYYLKSYLPKLSCLFLLMLTLLLVHSCKKESYQDISLSGEVDQAKSWYDGAYPASTTVGHVAANASGANNADLTQLTRPDWQHTASYSRFGKNVIEMPADPAHKLASAFRNANTGKVGSNKFSKTSFLLLKGSTGYQAYLMVIIADSAYLKGDFNKLNRNSYHKRDSDFTGDVLYFTPSGQYLRGYAYKNGHLLKPAAATAGPTLKTTGSSKLQPTELSCVAWFMGHYINGELVSSDYMYTICTGTDEGGGGGTPAPPAPICPPGTTATNPGAKLQVAEDDGPPADGLPPDDGGFPDPTTTTSPCVAPEIINNVQDSCLKKMVDSALNKNVKTAIDSLIQGVFGGTTKMNLSYIDVTTLGSGVEGHTTNNGYDLNGNLNIQVELNRNSLPSCSEQYIITVIMHEALHAYMIANGIDPALQHDDMFAYVSAMALSLQHIFPGLSNTDAKNLALGGLQYSPNFDSIKIDMGLVGSFDATQLAYSIGSLGTRCK